MCESNHTPILKRVVLLPKAIGDGVSSQYQGHYLINYNNTKLNKALIQKLQKI